MVLMMAVLLRTCGPLQVDSAVMADVVVSSDAGEHTAPIQLQYDEGITPRGSAERSWLRGVPGETVTITGTNWLFKVDPETTAVEEITITIDGHVSLVDGHTSIVRTLNETAKILHVRIPGDLPAG